MHEARSNARQAWVLQVMTVTAVSPSPQELLEELADEEKVALDLILPLVEARVRREDVEDPRLTALVPDRRRHAYLWTLADQVVGLGRRVHASAALAGAALDEQWRASAQARADEMTLAQLSPVARRDVARHRRRRAGK